MRLNVSTPLAVVVDADDVAHLRAEDETGAFGVMPGHADFLTVLAISVVTWRDRRGAEHHVAVRGGMFEVRGGDSIVIATKKQFAATTCAILRRRFSSLFAALWRKIELRGLTPNGSTSRLSARSAAFYDLSMRPPSRAAPALSVTIKLANDPRARKPRRPRRGCQEEARAAGAPAPARANGRLDRTSR
jgi:ATP synthase, F1 epsilon subunit (delta in mitochondria)